MAACRPHASSHRTARTNGSAVMCKHMWSATCGNCLRSPIWSLSARWLNWPPMRTGQVLVISTLARDAKLNAVTAGRYLDLLEASFLIRRLPPFLKNRSSRLVKSPKLHFSDSGLAAHMAGITAFESGRDDHVARCIVRNIRGTESRRLVGSASARCLDGLLA